MKSIAVPDIGDFKDVAVIEVLIAVGDTIAKDQPVAILESDKATMEIPSPEAGVVASVDIKVGDKVSAGSSLLKLESAAPVPPQEASLAPSGSPAAVAHRPPDITNVKPLSDAVPTSRAPADRAPAERAPADNVVPWAAAVAMRASQAPSSERIYAGPVVRKMARELGVDLQQVTGTGPRGRIVANDVREYCKSVMSTTTRQPAGRAGGAAAPVGQQPFELLPWPKVDYARFGPIEPQPLSRIRKISGANLHRNWVMIPHVTNHDDAEVTELEAFRADLNRESEQNGVKISPLAFIVKASVAALKRFPEFNSSLEGETLIVKRYYHIGFAADTPNGLVVPVIRDADQKGLVQIAREMVELAGRARAGKLALTDMQGGSFSISSLGGIGGSYFTPIINAPEVAILGVGKVQTRVVWADGRPQPRLFLPLSLSWDHRVVDGAVAGRFNAYLVKMLGDLRRLLM
jgi:pyruvate dehydrogenase E2 component (dihydrolipoamide acetyltransferase)